MSPADQIFRFGHCVLDEPRHQLWVNHQPVALQPRAHALLAHLLRHPGVTFTKAELLGAIWPADQVANEVLSGTVHRLRQALREAAPEVQIKTVFGVGYRLDALVRRLDAPPPPGDEGPLAVLPVVDDTADPTLGGVGEGLACLIHYQLSRLPHLVLLPLSESLATPADGTPVIRSAARLNEVILHWGSTVNTPSAIESRFTSRHWWRTRSFVPGCWPSTGRHSGLSTTDSAFCSIRDRGRFWSTTREH